MNIRSFNFLILAAACLNNITLYTTEVTSQFYNMTDLPILFQSFQDENNKPIETYVIDRNGSITSKIKASKTVQYRIHANIAPQQFTQGISTGAYNIIYNAPSSRDKFSLTKGSFINPNTDTYLTPSPAMQITNSTTFPIYISLELKDAGQTTQLLVPSQLKKQTLIPDAIPQQALNQTRLPVHGFYTVDDPLRQITISSAIKDYISPHHPLALVKSKYDIINKNGHLKITPHKKNH